MPGNLGDIVVSAGIDSRQWYEEAVKLQNSAKSLGSGIQAGIAGKSGIGGSIVSGVTNALSAGASGGIGGAVSSVSTAIGGALTKFGAWGVAAGAVVTTLGGIASEYIESRRVIDEFSAAIDRNVNALDRQVQKSNEAIQFTEKLRGLREGASAGDISTELRSRDVDLSKLRAERDLTHRALSDETFSAVKLGAVTITDPARRGLFNAGGLIDPRVSFSVSSKILGEEGASRLSGLYERFSKLNREIDVREKERGGIEALKPSATRLDEERFSSARLGDVLAARRSDPFIGAQIQAREIGILLGRDLDSDAGNRALTSVMKSFRGALDLPNVANQSNSASIGGTASGFSELQASIRQDRALQTDLSQIQKEQLTTLRQIVAEIRASNGLKTPEAEID